MSTDKKKVSSIKKIYMFKKERTNEALLKDITSANLLGCLENNALFTTMKYEPTNQTHQSR